MKEMPCKNKKYLLKKQLQHVAAKFCPVVCRSVNDTKGLRKVSTEHLRRPSQERVSKAFFVTLFNRMFRIFKPVHEDVALKFIQQSVSLKLLKKGFTTPKSAEAYCQQYSQDEPKRTAASPQSPSRSPLSAAEARRGARSRNRASTSSPG